MDDIHFVELFELLESMSNKHPGFVTGFLLGAAASGVLSEKQLTCVVTMAKALDLAYKTMDSPEFDELIRACNIQLTAEQVNQVSTIIGDAVKETYGNGKA